MTLVLYIVFSGSLFCWTISSILYSSMVPQIGYTVGMVILGIWAAVMYIIAASRRLHYGLMIMAVFMNLGMSVNYRCIGDTPGSTLKDVFQSLYISDMILMLAAFTLVFLVVRYTELYKNKLINFLTVMALPVFIYGARLSGVKVKGSYLNFLGFMIFGLVLMGYPFAAASFMAFKDNLYRRGKVSNMPWSLIVFLLYSFFLYAGCVLCNEFGLLLILGLTSTALFYIRCRKLTTKLFYTIACGAGALVAAVKIKRLWERILIWLDPASAYGTGALHEKAETVLYLFRHFNRLGFWGQGIGDLPKSIYDTLHNDHVLVLLMNDYSILLALAVVILGVLFVRWLFVQPEGLDVYDQYMNLTSALIVCFIILITVASNLGSFMTSGIGFPFISDGSAVNVMLASLTGIHFGILGKQSREEEEWEVIFE